MSWMQEMKMANISVVTTDGYTKKYVAESHNVHSERLFIHLKKGQVVYPLRNLFYYGVSYD
jgi:hypothetical protein